MVSRLLSRIAEGKDKGQAVQFPTNTSSTQEARTRSTVSNQHVLHTERFQQFRMHHGEVYHVRMVVLKLSSL